MSGHVHIHALLMPTMFVIYRADDGELVRMPGDQRDVLAKMDTRRSGLDVFEFTPNFRRRLRFGVKRLVMTHATPGIEDNAGPCLGATVPARDSMEKKLGRLNPAIATPERRKSLLVWFRWLNIKILISLSTA